MKMTIGEVIRKLDFINATIVEVQKKIDHDMYDSLEDAVELLEEYGRMIRSIEVDI